jgi:6-phosphogluconolactonase (cycloisomerase 2 family)
MPRRAFPDGGITMRAALASALVWAGVATLVAGVATPAASEATPDVVAAPDPGFVRPVYVTNRGIAWFGDRGPHVIAQYGLNEAGQLVRLGEPVASGLGARGIVFTPDARAAYVNAEEEHAIYSYRVGPLGELTLLGPPVDTAGVEPFAIAISPDGRHLYVPNQASHTVAVFAIGPSGMPSLVGAPVVTGAPNPRNVAVSPDGRFLFVGHGIPPDQDPDVLVVFPIRGDGTLGPAITTVPIGASGNGMVTTPDGRFLYVSCALSDQVFGFRIEPDGHLAPLPGFPVAVSQTPEGLAMSPDGRHLTVAAVATQPVLALENDGLWSFDIGDDGALIPVGTRFEAAAGPGETTTPDGHYLIVGNFFANTVAAFDAATLRELPGSPAPSFGEAPSFNSTAVLPNQGPLASFTASARRLVVNFDATASMDRDGRIARYDWDFGDGTILRDGGPRPTHAYRESGTYPVTLVITDNEGCSDSEVFTGRTPLCAGTPAARTTRVVVVR